MVNSVGKKLQQARIGKQISVEEAARVTRIRPDKLIDLEEDNYANFPSMSYAKGFLLIYARFLNVDVSDFADSLHTPSTVSTDDYEYLTAAASAAPPPSSRRPYHFEPRRQRTTLLPIVVFGVLIAGIALVIYVFTSLQRLGNLNEGGEKNASPAASPAISTVPVAMPVPVVVPAPALRASPPALAASTPAAAPRVAAATPAPAPNTPATPAPRPSVQPAAVFDPSREVRRAEPVVPAGSPQAAAMPSAPETSATLAALEPIGAGPLKHIIVTCLKQTYVTIRKDVADSAPVYEDTFYPGNHIPLDGHKVWIQVQNPGAVQVTVDGKDVPADQSAIEIE